MHKSYKHGCINSLCDSNLIDARELMSSCIKVQANYSPSFDKAYIFTIQEVVSKGVLNGPFGTY